ncbi:amino acid/amide ABC transporter substrate-binding protein (HAAT family) [Aneurinibacillus soli]|uniref:Leucine-, isoleucine-, valine-, threonine-, and alanine-binding protein n=1 Tax=Aneurinibacillus soli TaxID=1500254 RepID=A0A0U5B1J6_9BACL|nr:ABC transporter substrate-binding protein [Aneurinibacillus soli]PYE60615.1 amino acid/amide ABC transporter substrate-binding protein (HAAT family) [Aneurinibacillus soli]BAU29861.1 Leucine-, isoleucine-, valine-, threonine-, and alanine-binding protein precursor [Aneurinibacillus soli]
MDKRKALGIAMSLMLSAGVVAGCGGGAKETGAGADKKPAGGSGDTIKIGENLELSGGVASYGQSLSEGLELALEEINKEGVNGKKFEVVKVDNKSDPAEATAGALKLISQNKVVTLVGAATSTSTLSQVQIAEKNKIPLITPTGTNPDITSKAGKVNDFVFRTCFIDPFQGTVAANFASKELKSKNAAIFTETSSDYSKGLAKAFEESYTKNGGKVAAKEAYVKGDTDFRATLTRIKAANPDFVFLPGYYEEVGLIVKQAREIGLNVPFMGGDGWDSPKLIEIAGAKALNNTYITNHYSVEDKDPKVQKFVSAFKAKYKDKAPDGFAALGYDTGYLLADAIKRAGDVDPVKIKEALASTKDLELVSGKITIDAQHNPIKSAAILEYKDGKQTFKMKVNP